MKKTAAKNKKNNSKNPVREGTPHSIADDKKRKDKNEYPFPTEQDKQYKDQPEFIDPGSNSSKNK